MAEYLIYGKRTERIYDVYSKTWTEPDTTFRALNANGERVTKLKDAFSFATREDAQDFIDNRRPKPGVIFEIRKAR